MLVYVQCVLKNCLHFINYTSELCNKQILIPLKGRCYGGLGIPVQEAQPWPSASTRSPLPPMPVILFFMI